MRLSLLAGTVLLALAAAVPARAAVTILPAIDAEFFDTGTGFGPGGAALGFVGVAGYSGDPADESDNIYAIQFNLGALPAGATVTQATLQLRDSRGAPFITAYGFAGNGSFSAAGVTTGTPLFGTQSGNSLPVGYDVTAFVQGLSVGAYAGFSLQQGGTPEGNYGLFNTTQDDDSPQLTVTYEGLFVPAPPSLALLASGLIGLGLIRRRRRTA